MDSRKATFYDLLDDLNTLLAPYAINPALSDIFADTILKAAGIKTIPTRCEISPDDEYPDSLLINIDGISDVDADTFQTFLIATDGVNPFSDLSESGSEADAEYEDDSSDVIHESYASSTASTEDMTIGTQSDTTSTPSTPSTPATSDDEEATVADDDQPDYQFSVSIKHAREYLMPIFNREFDLMSKEDIEDYQLRSLIELDSFLEINKLDNMRKLDNLYAEIIRLTIELQSSSISKYTKGQLNIILDDMVLPPLKQYHSETKGHDCPAAISLLQAVNNHSKLYDDHVTTDRNLSSNEVAKELQADVSNYIKTAAGLIELNKVKSINQSLGSLIGLFGKQSKPMETKQTPESSLSEEEAFIESLLPTWKV